MLAHTAVMPLPSRAQRAAKVACVRWRLQGLKALVTGLLMCLAMALMTSLSMGLTSSHAAQSMSVPSTSAYTLSGDFSCGEGYFATATLRGVQCVEANPDVSLWDSSMAADDHEDTDREVPLEHLPKQVSRPRSTPLQPLIPLAEFRHSPLLRPPQQLG